MSSKKCVVNLMPSFHCDLTIASMHSPLNGLKTTMRKMTASQTIFEAPRTFVVDAAIAVQDRALGEVDEIPDIDAEADA